jgi:hypothetical protein
MNAIVKTNTGTAVAKRDTSPIIRGGQIGKALAIAANDVLETYRTPNMTPEQAGATMRAYLRVMQGHSEAVVARALNDLIVNNPAGRWLPSPVDLRDAIDRIEYPHLWAFWRKLNVRLNMVAPDVREALREEIFDAVRSWLGSHGMEPTVSEWEQFVTLAQTARATKRDGVLVPAELWLAKFMDITASRMLDDALKAAVVAVRPDIEADFVKHRKAIEALVAHARRREAAVKTRFEAKRRYDEAFEALADKIAEYTADGFQRALDALPIVPAPFDEPEPAVPDVAIIQRFRKLRAIGPDDDASAIFTALVRDAAWEQVPSSLKGEPAPNRRTDDLDGDSRCRFQFGAAGERANSTPEIDRKLGLGDSGGEDR